jgi:cell wall-active antibiotic response 4TMS protein YvqF
VSSEQPPPERAAPPASETPAEPAPPEPSGRRLPLGRLVLGLVLVGIGVIWLLQALDVVNFSLLAVLPVALIIVGIAMIGMARTGRHAGLITLGLVLTVILTIAAGFDIRLQGGVGDKIERPTSRAEVQREYHLSVGQLTINLRHVNFVGGATKVKATVGIGQLTVRVPNDILVIVHGHAGAGQVMLFGQQTDGLDVDRSVRVRPGNVALPGEPPNVPLDSTLNIDLSVGLGQIEVTQ